MTSERLSAVIRPGALVAPDDIHLVPALIAGDQAAWRYLEFFAANIRNANTRRAYARACQQFFTWCDERGLILMTIRPVDVARYIETRQQTHSAPDVKQPCVTCNSAAALKKLPHRAAASNVLIARKGKSEARIGIFNRDYGPTD